MAEKPVLEKELRVQEISTVTKQNLLNKSAFSLPDNPAMRGMKPNEIKKYLYSAIIDYDDKFISKHPSVIGIIETLISDINKAFNTSSDYLEEVIAYIEYKIREQETNIEEEINATNDELAKTNEALATTNFNLEQVNQDLQHEKEVRAIDDKLIDTKILKEISDRITVVNELRALITNLQNAGFITKDETYSKAEIDELYEVLAGLGIEFNVVETLPPTGENKYIYLLSAKDAQDQDIYEEYVYIRGAWERIGSTAVNLADYYTKSQIDALLKNYVLNSKLDAYYNKEQIDKLLENFSGGGGGGSSNNAELKVQNTTGWIAKTFASGSECILKINWISIEDNITTGNGTLKILVGGVVKTSYEIEQGNVEINVTKFLNVGNNDIKIIVSDIYGNNKELIFNINIVSLTISSYFDGNTAYTGAIPFLYTPVGDVEKTVHFIIDGKEEATQIVTVSNREQTFTIPAQSHNNHTFEVYFTAIIDEKEVESNHLYYDIICYEEGNNKPIIAVPIKLTEYKQYSTIAIPYIVYTPNIFTSTVVLKDENNETTLTVDRQKQIWSYKAINYGNKSLSITSGDTSRTITFKVTENKIDVNAETTNLELYLTSEGRSNKEDTPLKWEYNTISASLTGFNLTSDGWKLDEANNTVLRVAGDARVYIPFNIFGSDFRTTGKTIEVEFATRDVLNYDAVIFSSWSGERGIKITAQKALLKSEQSEIFTQYKENETVRVAFTVEKRAENRLLAIYINGIMSGVVQYPIEDDFSQTTPVGITIGSNYCTTDIYSIRVYNINLNRYQILDNWIADTQDVTEMINRYERNNIFDTYGNISISKLPSYLPYMVLNVSKYSDLPQSKGDKKTISGKYVDTLYPERSFTFSNAQIDVQGTSSQYYSRKNYKIKFLEGFVLKNTISPTYQLRSNSIPTDEFTFKADVASSEGANNVELVRLYDDTCPVKTPPQQDDSRVRQGIEGYPCIMFYGEGETLTFLGKYNFNNDKATEEVFGFKPSDESWEILQNNTEMVIWKDDNFEGDAWKTSFEARYPEKSTNIAKLKEFSSWLKSTDTTAVSSEADKQARIEKFKTEFSNYANVDAMLFNYIFTEMFLMVDNRAKNAFPTRYSEDGKWLILPYDYDTAIGINNEGELKFGYDLEDTDHINGNNVFNGQDSVLYVNMRLAFADEIMQMYKELRTGDVFSYEEIEKRFEEHQSVWGEAVFNEDARFKYIEPLINENNKTYLPMLQGAKAEQRKWWLYNRFRYLDSKYNAGDALEDFIVVRSYAVADIEVTPYADIYATAKFDSALVQKRALRGNSYTLENPLSGGRDAVISIYSASQLSAIGDLSGLKVGMADFSKAVKLSALKVGDGATDYDNPNLTDLTIGNLVLLRTLDVRNCSSLTQSVDISGCTNIEEVYFDGTATTGITLPNGGNLKKLHLPATVTNLTILNQKQLTEFVMPSFANISTLRLENINPSAIDSLSVLDNIQPLSRVRLIGVDWSIANSTEVFAVMDKLDTFRGLDENGNNANNAVVSGTIHVPSLTREEFTTMNTRYPNITIDYDIMTVKVTFYNGDIVVNEQWVPIGEDITIPETPTKESTVQYVYTFTGWSLDGENVVEIGTAGTQNLTYYALFSEAVRYYTVRFLNGGTVLQTSQVPYGEMPEYTGTAIDNESTVFEGWQPAISEVTGDIDYIAKTSVREYTVRFLNTDGTVLQTGQVPYGTIPVYTGNSLDSESTVFEGWQPAISAVTGNIDYTAKTSIRTYTVRFLNSDGTVLQEGLVAYGVVPTYEQAIPVDPSGDDKKFIGWIPSIVTVTEDATYTADFKVPPSLAYELGGNDTYYRVVGRGEVTDADIVIPDTHKGLPVSYIYEAFKNDLTITSVTIPSTIISISMGSFRGSTNIKNIYYGGTLEQYCKMDWQAKKPAHNLYINGQLLSGHLVIPNTVSHLNGYAFANVGNITEYTAPSSWAMPTGIASSLNCFEGCPDLEKLNQSWAYIHNDMFAYCSKLKTIPALNNTIVVYERAFMGTALESVTFGSNIQFINEKSFYDCPNLKTITITRNNTPPNLGANAFAGTTKLQAIYVPSTRVDQYKSATNWSNYADIIQAIP